MPGATDDDDDATEAYGWVYDLNLALFSPKA